MNPKRYISVLVILCFANLVTSRMWLEGDIRLVGGRRRYMGTVVILHKGKWGSICDEQWGMNDASVVCRQLGYTFAVRATTRSEFGPGRRRKWLSHVRCRGSEERLEDCPFRGYDRFIRYRCPGRYRSAGVICSAALPSALKLNGATSAATRVRTKVHKKTAPPRKAKTTTAPKMLSLISSPEATDTAKTSVFTTSLPTTLKITTTGTPRSTGTNSPTLATPTTAKSATSSTSPAARTIENTSVDFTVSATSTSPTTMSIAHKAADDRTTSITILESNLLNSDMEDKLTKTTISVTESGINRLAANSRTDTSIVERIEKNLSDIGVNSQNNGPSTESESISTTSKAFQSTNALRLDEDTDGSDTYLADAPLAEDLEIRLKGGRYKWEGHLQVRINGGAWGAVCSDHWTMREAMVACNQLKEYGKAKQALLTTYFGGLDVPKLIHRLECVGRESSLSSCKLTKLDEDHSCSKKTAVAGIVCSHHLPDLVPNLRAVEDSVRLQDQPLYYLRCSMEENCLADSAYVIKNTSLTWRNSMRRLLRFSTVVHNRGLADFKPFLPRGQWQWHACHMHYHSMEVFAHYDIIDSNGTRLAEGSKASFCLEDTTCDRGVHPQFNCRGFAEQGLSVNCSDNYMYDIDCQWIDITDIKPGDYTFLMEVNPTMLVAESNFDNNIVSCHLYYNGFFASLKRCHYESLLDHRVPVKIYP